MEKKRLIILASSAVIVLAAIVYWSVSCSRNKDLHGDGLSVPEENVKEINQLYGIDYSNLTLEEGVVGSGQTVSHIFSKYGVSPVTIDKTARTAKSVFNLRNMRAGNKYTVFLTQDSLPQLAYFVYEHSLTDYVVISYVGDSIAVKKEHKEVVAKRKMATAKIKSSLWNSMVDAGMTPALSMNLSEVYAWSIDFFGLREGDQFTVIYDELFVDNNSVGAGRIWGAVFNHAGKEYYAIPFKQGGRITYWDTEGNSLRKTLLKAPLKYSRISSKFSNSRLHPVLKIRRPHHGVDYAAPAGTPVHAVADGTVIFRGWDSKGGGNTLKIKHARNLVTGYLHLKGFAKGISNGSRVNQGDLIGYVGSTGTSTGPHLDYRIWKNGKPIDPLNVTAESAEPVSKQNKADFELVRDRILAELRGEKMPDDFKVSQLDSISVYRAQSFSPAGAER